MKPTRFLLTAVGFFALLGALYLEVFLIGRQQPFWPYHWLRNVYRVKDRMAAESRAPRCLLVGGSSVWFGFQSGLIEQATGWQVVNLGTHAEVPLEFELWQAECYLRRGDTVVLANELTYYWPRPHVYNTYVATEISLMAPEYWWQASWWDKYEILAAIPPARVATNLTSWLARGTDAYREQLALPSTPQLMKNLEARWAGTFAGEIPAHYNYLEVDAHGDNVRVRTTAEHTHEDYGLNAVQPEAPRTWRLLEEFERRMQARGVRCLATWPPFERHPGVDYTNVQVQANFAELRRRWTAAGYRVIGEPEDGMMTTGFFYDTPYHLTNEGARLRTLRWVERLKAAKLK